MTLEDMIRDLAERGELNNLSVGGDATGKAFTASFAPASTFGCVFVTDPDPVKALTEAIKGAGKLARKRRTVEKPTVTPAADDMDFG